MAGSAWQAKLRRARHHERDLEAALRDYSQLDPFELVSTLEGNDLVVRVHIRHEIPEDLSLIAGDLLHNARSALDLLITSVARDFAVRSGRDLSPADELALSFPISRTESRFNSASKEITPLLPDVTMRQLRTMQPWSIVEGVLARKGIAITPRNVDIYIWMDDLLRLSALDNLNKHRELLALDFHRATITLGDDNFDPFDDGQDSEREPVNLDGLDPETRENLTQSILKMQEEDARPDSYDFYFTGGEIFDGAEIGRYIRHDRGQMPAGLTARGNLRLVLWEPEVMERFRGAPPLQQTVREMIDAVERMCTFIEAGVPPSDTDEPAQLCRLRHGLAPFPPGVT